MLVSGEHDYPSRSQAAMALTLAMANRGWGWEDFHAALTNPDHRMGSYYTHRRNGAPRRPHDVAARLRRDWQKASDIVRGRPAVSGVVEMRQELSLDLAVLADEVWTGRTAVTDYLVLTAAFEIGRERGSREPHLATRTVAEKAGVSQKAARTALNRLTEAGHLVRKRKSEGNEAAVYRLLKRPCAEDSRTSHGRPPSGGESPEHSLLEMAGSNAFRWLGRYALMVYRAVASGARTVREIMEYSGVSRRTVFKYLAYLTRDKLVSKVSGEYTAADLGDLDDLAQALGAPDRAGEQRRRHREERRYFRTIKDKVRLAQRWTRLNHRRT